MLWVVGAILLWMSPPLRTLQRGHSYKISPKPCLVNGLEGTCMFVWECIKTEGRHVGMCVDTFMFGSCCTHNLTENVILAQHPDILYSPPSPNNSHVTEQPSVSKPTRPSNFTLRPQLGSTFLTSITRPSNSSSNYATRPDPIFVSRPHTFTSRPPGSITVLYRPDFTSRPPASTSSSPSIIVLQSSNGKEPPKDDTSRPPSSTAFSESDGDGMMETAGSVWSPVHTAPSAIWQAATEPGFVTRPRPPSSSRPWPTRRPTTASTSTTTTATTTTTTTATTTTSTTASTTTTRTTTTVPTTTTTPTTTTKTTTLAPTMTLISESVSAANNDKGVQCGVAPLFPRPEMRIVGGRNAPFGGWPWQVSVRRTSFFGFSSTHRCGGALLNENWIATAGHCVDDLLTSQIRIRVGEYDFSSVQEPYPYVERGVGRKVVHPKYNFFTYEYDLALIRLESTLTFAPHIAPVCLPASDDLLIGENATVTGWGRLSEGGTLPSVLQEVSVPIVSNDCCKSMFLRAGRHEFIPEIFLCAGHENGGQDSCQGDSGGPLQVRGKDGRYFLAGIISWGIGCAEANLPGVCTRISKFVPWILENVT